MSNTPQLHEKFRYSVDYVGNEREPVLIIDEFLADAKSLVDFAQQSNFNSADTYYPGLRAPAPNLYLEILSHYLHDIVAQTFGLRDENVKSAKADFSLVVTPPKNLKPMQTIPHFDSTKRSELAAVHYLCDREKGGTSLYRHRATGFEYVDEKRIHDYGEIVRGEMEKSSCLPAYINGSNDHFVRTASYEAVFNRFIMYRCTSLHSGNIASDFDFDKNPRTGRLTLNTFIFCHE